MKQLLLLTFLCVVPSAHAVDYVKCEAVQKAAARVEASADWRPTYRAELKAKQEAACGTMSDWRARFASRSDFWDCQSRAAIFQTEAIKQAWIDDYQAPMKARLAKIQADYDAAGCY
jgi:hypothetical protein